MPLDTPYSLSLLPGALFLRFFVEASSVFGLGLDSRLRLRDAGGPVRPTSESEGSGVRWVAATIPREARSDARPKKKG